MRAVVQRVVSAEVRVEGEVVGAVGKGLLVLVGVEEGDSQEDVSFISRKVLNLRVFDDSKGRMDLSVTDVEGEVLLISQFTLFGDCRKGSRPSFSRAASPKIAEELYLQLRDRILQGGISIQTGQFRARMEVSSINEGPVTLIVDSKQKRF